MLLISDIALGVYGFVERAAAGASLIANKALNKQIWSLRQLLPVHHLTCEFEKTPVSHASSFCIVLITISGITEWADATLNLEQENGRNSDESPEKLRNTLYWRNLKSPSYAKNENFAMAVASRLLRCSHYVEFS